MVSSVEENATRAGVAMLEQGGNAVDAAVATAYALAVTHPSAGNIGGGGFMLVRLKGGPAQAIDFRERAPLAVTPKLFSDMLMRKAIGAGAAGVPGSVAGLNLAQARFGKLPLAAVLAPAIRLAEDGHKLGLRQAQALSWAWPVFKRGAEARRIFGRGPGGKQPKRAGDKLLQPDLGRTLRRIQTSGDAGFYAGPSAELLVRAMQRDGGLISHEDLTQYRAVLRAPLKSRYRGFDVEVMPPVSAGGVAVTQMLQMLSRLQAYEHPANSTEALHLFAEVAKRAHAERRFHVVDPDSVADYDDAARRLRWGDPDTWLKPYPVSLTEVTSASKLHPLYAAAKSELDNTTHLSTADADGNVVSLTTSLSAGYGARYVVPGLGVVLGNSLAAFGSVGEDVVKPGRRMTSSMAPTIVSRDGAALLVLGSPGGDTIPNTVVQVLRNVIDDGMTLDDAVDAPRIHHGFVPDLLRYEGTHPPQKDVLESLGKLGHQFAERRFPIGDANNILIAGDVQYGYADPREGGLALGPALAPAPVGSPKGP
jgi:gamma-glutamyltranspeptidase/glutathione hydrolase